MNRKDFLDCMIELRNKGKNITQGASPANGQKDSPKFSKFFESDCDVTAVQPSLRVLYATLFRHVLDKLEKYPQRDISATFAVLLLLLDFQFVNADS
jgi:hypothetical protein